MDKVRVTVIAGLLTVFAAHLPLAGAQQRQTPTPLEPVYLRRVVLDGFWKDQTKRLTEKWIPHCIVQMEEGGRGQELLNLIHTARVLRGVPTDGQFTGCPWSDAYVYNTVEAICLALAIDPGDDTALADAQKLLRVKLEEWIPIILAAQCEDGYIHSYHIVNRYPRYRNIHDHEFYVQGYFIEMGVAHYLVSGGEDRRLYDAARRCADHLCDTFGPSPKRTWVHGHPGIEIALNRLGRLVNEAEGTGAGDKYIELCKFLYASRHTVPNLRSEYRQSHLPAVEQRDAAGHAVRATYFYAGIADVAMLTDDPAYLAAADRLWESAVHRKMYVTGGVGSTGEGEAFAEDFELPNETAYCESCAGCGMVFWADRMHRIHQDAAFMDVQERVLYNNVLGAIELSGQNFFYQNPLTSSQKRYPWHGCPCCVGNIPRTLLAIKDGMYSLNSERDTLYVHHFVASQATLDDVRGSVLDIAQETEYPWDGRVLIAIRPANPTEMAIKLRIPSRADSRLHTATPSLAGQFTLRVNGIAIEATTEGGYATVKREWTAGDTIELSLPIEIQRIRADERVEANRGRVALQRGPLVYNVEDVDNEDQADALVLTAEQGLKAVWRDDLLGGVMTIVSDDGRLTAVPHHVRQNRGGNSLVWIAERPEVAEPYREPTIASEAKVTTSFVTQEGRFSLRAIHDLREPKQSDERGTPLFHWWPRRGTLEWVQYDFTQPETISAVEVYWYDDRGWGGCRTPASWRVVYRDGDDWRPVKNASPYGVERDRFNRVTFDAATTDALRLEVQLESDAAAGILEWRVE